MAKRDPILIVGSEYVPWSDYIRTSEHLKSIDSRLNHTKEHEAATNALYVNAHSDLPFVHRENGDFYPGTRSREFDLFRVAIKELGFIPMCTLFTSGSFIRQSATTKLDFVYAFRGLLPAEEQQLIQVDYSKSRMRIFHNAIVVAWSSTFGRRELTRLGGMPGVLNFYRASLDGVDDAPSWVPDLSRQHGKADPRWFVSLREAWRTTNIQLSPDKKTLTLHGIYFDAIPDTCTATNLFFSLYKDGHFSVP